MSGVNLRGLRAAVLNPSDLDVQELSRQLGRIGISVRVISDVTTLSACDFLFVVIADDSGYPLAIKERCRADLIQVAIVESETPTVLEHLSHLDADAVIVKPFRPTGLLASLVHAYTRKAKQKDLKAKIDRLERKLKGVRVVEKAKEIIAIRQKITPNEAFAMLRRHAMAERTTVEHVAETIVSADRVFSCGEIV